MGNATSLKNKLKEKSEKRSKKSNRFNPWGCLKRANIDEDPIFIGEPPIQKIHLREIILSDPCLLNTQMFWLRKLTSEGECYLENAPQYVKRMFDAAENLRATGFELDDKWFVNLLLAGLIDRFSPMIKEIESSKVKLTSEFVRWKILEHANKRYFCMGCKCYTPNILCGCGYMMSRMERETRDGSEVNVFYNY